VYSRGRSRDLSSTENKDLFRYKVALDMYITTVSLILRAEMKCSSQNIIYRRFCIRLDIFMKKNNINIDTE